MDKLQDTIAAIAGVSQSRIAEAHVVAQFAPHLTDEVIAKQTTHTAAYDTARAEKQRRETVVKQEAELREKAPELLARMGDDFTLAMAWVAYQERDKERLEQERSRQAMIRDVPLSLKIGVGSLAQYARHDGQRDALDAHDALPDITEEELQWAEQTIAMIRAKNNGRNEQ